MVLSDNGKTSRYTYNASGERIVKSLGIAPGVPTMKGSYGDPENTGVGYNSILTELGKHDVPENWIQLPKNDGKGTSTGSGANATPGVPIAWEDPSNPENAPLVMAMSLVIPQNWRRPFIIIVTTLAQQAMLPMRMVTSRSMKPIFLMVSCWSMSTRLQSQCRTSLMASNLMTRRDSITMVQGI